MNAISGAAGSSPRRLSAAVRHAMEKGIDLRQVERIVRIRMTKMDDEPWLKIRRAYGSTVNQFRDGIDPLDAVPEAFKTAGRSIFLPACSGRQGCRILRSRIRPSGGSGRGARRRPG